MRNPNQDHRRGNLFSQAQTTEGDWALHSSLPFREAVLVKSSSDDSAVIEERLDALLIGRNPLRHRETWQQRWGPDFGDVWAVGAIDIVPNDLWGKALNLPIVEL